MHLPLAAGRAALQFGLVVEAEGGRGRAHVELVVLRLVGVDWRGKLLVVANAKKIQENCYTQRNFHVLTIIENPWRTTVYVYIRCSSYAAE